MRSFQLRGRAYLLAILLLACGDDTDSSSEPMADAGPDADVFECGDRVVQPGEQCDDGNVDPGDGCDEACEIERGFTCPPGGGRCAECGDDQLDAPEACDDGNDESGDGCSDRCQIEEGFTCAMIGEPCEECGNGELEPNETCDEGNFADGMGCSEDCRTVHDGFRCETAGEACSECGDGVLSGDEICDDGNTESGDGCVESCLAIESGFSCPEGGGQCALCGDGVLDLGEACDDGNFQSGDGCDAACRPEHGSVCLRPGILCSVCGNGFLEVIRLDDNGTPDDPSDDFHDEEDEAALEACDDGNDEDDDGCSQACEIEDGGDLPWVCPLPGVACGRCGDGMVQAIETCDDGNAEGDDGCSSDCTAIEPGFLCPADGGLCVACGDGSLDEPLEQCDDANPFSGDGCSRKCEIEADFGWVCPVAGGACELCGNGVHEPNEACDDGNAHDDDGCAGDCQAEENDYNCYFPGFACAHCGDGELQPGEGCDEGHLSSGVEPTGGCIECERTAAWACPAAGAPCELCGDRVLGGGDALSAFETCDDGNTLDGDGCSSVCQAEPGFVCDGEECSAASCGDGFVATGEECDDGGRAAGDGCSFLCRVEPGFECSGALGCRRTRCGDGIVEGDEECDDAGAVCTGGSADGMPCVSEEALATCRGGAGACAASASDGCNAACELEEGFACELPGQPCTPTICGDGVVEGTEECDVGASCEAGVDPLDGTPCLTTQDFADCAAVELGVSGCVAIDSNGCDTACKLKQGYKCEAGETCTGEWASECCELTVCGDGLVEGSEGCDDGELPPIDGDGCSVECAIEDFHRCEHEDLGPSTCRPIIEYVSVRRFRIPNISPEALLYDPERRSFGGHKQTYSVNNPAIELCLDGTIINQGDTLAGPLGTVYAPGADPAELPLDCSDAAPGELCYEAPLRPDIVSSSNMQSVRDGTFDPVTSDWLFTYDIAGSLGTLLVQLPLRFAREQSVDLERFGVRLGFNGSGITVGEDGDLYIVDSDAEVIRVLPRLRDDGVPRPAPDCSAVGDPVSENCTSFSNTPDEARERAADSTNPLDAIFTLPGESLVGIFNRYTEGGIDAPSYDGIDLVSGSTVNNANYFSIYDTELLDAPRRSALPGVLFSLGSAGTSYENAAQAAETAADGGAFIVCAFTGSQDCQLFARVCESDADCPPGTSCNHEGVDAVGVAYCNAPGEARDDFYRVARDVHKQCSSGGSQDGLDCTASATSCEAEGGSCEQVGQDDPQFLDVLANDSLSESACIDPRMVILAVCGDHVTQPYEAEHPETCPEDTEPDPIGEVTFDEGEIDYDAPNDGSCGFFDSFEYTVDLGGGDIDTARVRVAVNCVCGDGLVDGSEQCDDGEFNGAPGACVEACDNGDAGDDVLARCNDLCLLNVECGDEYIVAPEECDDGNTANGDGCSAACTRESECGNGITELGEDCDDGPTGSDDCNPGCTVPVCGDGNLDRAKGEQCDDGNLRSADGCSSSCQVEARCGNRVVEPGEDCDDGNIVAGDGCSGTCRVENICGNGDREGAEVCDGTDFGSCPAIDGTQIQCINSTPGSPNICLCKNYCGDERIGASEECDDGREGSDSCRGDAPDEGDPCTEIRCGDGVLDEGEVCDDGNTNPADGCNNSCHPLTSCGNGALEAPEECDDDNNVSGDGCTSTCQDEAESCGDEVVDPDEQCDDGNTQGGDGCTSNCRLEGAYCGDGNLDVGELCDDGNTRSGDGCGSDCRLEVE